MKITAPSVAGHPHEQGIDLDLPGKPTSRLSVATPLHDVLGKVVRLLSGAMQCDYCLIYVLEEDELILAASGNFDAELADRVKMKLRQGITSRAAEHIEPITIAERAYLDQRLQTFHELSEDRFEALLSVPVVKDGRMAGAINILNGTPHFYGDSEIGMVATIGYLIGAEVERARLESENAQLLDRLATRTSVDRAKGVLQRNLHISEDEAYRMLRRQSQNKRKSMKDIAEIIMQDDDPMRLFR